MLDLNDRRQRKLPAEFETAYHCSTTADAISKTANKGIKTGGTSQGVIR
jgi:hypothetical protein